MWTRPQSTQYEYTRDNIDLLSLRSSLLPLLSNSLAFLSRLLSLWSGDVSVSTDATGSTKPAESADSTDVTGGSAVGQLPLQSTAASAIVAEVRIDHDRLVLRPTLRRLPSATIVPEYHARTEGERTLLFVSVRADCFETAERALGLDPTISEPMLVDRFDDRRVYRVQLTDSAVTVRGELASIGGRLLESRGTPTGWILQLRMPTRESLVAFNDHCKDLDVSVQVTHLRMAENDDDALLGLTAKQQELLTAAYEAGYFDVPRGISQDELADRLGVSKSAVSQRLRRAMAELCEASFGR